MLHKLMHFKNCHSEIHKVTKTCIHTVLLSTLFFNAFYFSCIWHFYSEHWGLCEEVLLDLLTGVNMHICDLLKIARAEVR